MNEIYAGLLGVVLVVGGFLYYHYGPELEQLTVGAISTFKSVQLAASPSNGDCLTTNGTDNAWGNCGGVGSIDGTGVANTIAVWSDADTLTATSGNPLYATRFTATSTTASSTLPRIVVSTALDFFGTFANSLDDLCVAITGGAGLCDGNDASGGGGGSGTVSTSTGETGDQLAFWTTTGGTPALLGSDAGLSYSSTTDRLTTINASTTRLTALTEAKFGATATATISSAGILTLPTALAVSSGGTGLTTFGGTNRILFTTSADNLTSDGDFTFNIATAELTLPDTGEIAPQTTGNGSLGLSNRFWSRLYVNYASTTALSTSYASSTAWFGGGLLSTCASGSFVTWTAGVFGCDTDDNTTYTAGDNITLTGTDFDVDDAFILNTGDTGTGNYTWSGDLNLFTKYVGIGTTTPKWPLQIASSTRPQLTLSDGTNTSNHWSFRNAGGILYIATSSPLTFATSTLPALTIQPGSVPSLAIGTTTCSGQFCLGPVTPNASSTEAYGKWQADFYNSAGTRSCMFVVGTTLTVIAGACNQ
jgi:hypothetical protein